MPNFSLSDEVFLQGAQAFSTPFHLYTEEGIRKTIRRLQKAFSGIPDYQEYFAVKALPTPAILRIFREEGCGVDCASQTELMLANACGFTGKNIMFSANDVPEGEFQLANALDAYINLDDVTHVEFLRKAVGEAFPNEICLRYNPGEFFAGNEIMGTPTESKYGMTDRQMLQALVKMKEFGVNRFGIHSFLSSNTTDREYYPCLARLLFQKGIELQEKTGIQLSFINLSGGIGIPYHPYEPEADIEGIGEGVYKAWHEIFESRGINNVAVKSELGRYMTGPNGWLVTRVIHEKNIYRHYLGVDASACDLMRPAMYGAYHHITVPGKEQLPHTMKVDVVGSLCENNDKFAVERMLPQTDIGDLIVIHDTGAHGRSMGYNYNGKLRCKEVLYTLDGQYQLIRRDETPLDYFATLDCDSCWEKLKQNVSDMQYQA